MRSIRYEAPDTVDGAVALLAEAGDKARPLAGGTDLIVQMRARMVSPEVIVDVKNIPELLEVREEGGGFRVGAAVPGAVLGENEAVVAMWPGVVEAFELIGSTQIQGRASLGGNLCNASPAADSTPAMIAAGVTCEIAGPGGRREAPVEDIVTAPGQTSLGDGEFVVSLFLPAASGPDRGRVPSLHSPDGDGHRGGRGRGVRHPRRGRHLHRGPGGSRGGGADPPARVGGGRRPRRHQPR